MASRDDDEQAMIETPEVAPSLDSRFPELAEIQREIELRIRDNKRFLERFMDEDFEGEEDSDQAEDSETYEEL